MLGRFRGFAYGAQEAYGCSNMWAARIQGLDTDCPSGLGSSGLT
jgi:hypothetical protein